MISENRLPRSALAASTRIYAERFGIPRSITELDRYLRLFTPPYGRGDLSIGEVNMESLKCAKKFCNNPAPPGRLYCKEHRLNPSNVRKRHEDNRPSKKTTG